LAFIASLPAKLREICSKKKGFSVEARNMLDKI